MSHDGVISVDKIESLPFGTRVRELRKQRGMTLANLASSAQVSKGYLSRLETGAVLAPSDEVVSQLATALGMSIERLRPAPDAPSDYGLLRPRVNAPITSPQRRPRNEQTGERAGRMTLRSMVDATDLIAWADRRDAQGTLPQLLRRLILATTERISHIHFPAGEGVQSGGWDGVVVTDVGNEYVPAGQSGWEMGANQAAKAKAESDFVKRTKDPENVNPSEATFVFVTPRRWRSKDQWAIEKTREGPWRKVLAYDAHDLETWLELAPSVHVWITERLGKAPAAARDLGAVWRSWSEATSPPLSAGLVVGGRTGAAERIVQQLRSSPCATFLVGDSQEEALAFLAACMQGLPSLEGDAFLARSLVIEDSASWRLLALSNRPLILVPRFDDADVVQAVRCGHHVVIPLGGESRGRNEQMELLPRPHRAAVRDALLQMGCSEKQADSLATQARHSLLALRRTLAVNPSLKRPAWSLPGEEAPTMLPALLAGAWDGSREADQIILADLAGHPYDRFSRLLARWANTSDPPLRQIGTNWLLVSRDDAWGLLSRFLTVGDLRRFEAVVLTVLGAINPALDLPLDQRWMAGVYDRVLPHSPLLREGIAETLAVMGARGGAICTGSDLTFQDHAVRIVRALLTRAKTDTSGQLWSSFSDVLPLLAEAAPDIFLDSLPAGLAGDQPAFLSLFTDSDQASATFSTSPHTGLLWALENLAWSPEYLSNAALFLARLATIDPGGKLGNRPGASLHQIFVLWHPQTAASLDERLAVLDMLRQQEPAMAWRLMIGLLPRFHDIATPTHSPRWREWTPEDAPVVPMADWLYAINEIARRLLEDVGVSGERWQSLIQIVDALPEDIHEAVVTALDTLDIGALTSDARNAIWSAVRDVVAQHRQVPEAKWAMPALRLARLSEVSKRFEPDNPVQRYAWLFASYYPDLSHEVRSDWQRYRQALAEARSEAVNAIYQANGVPGILDLAKAAAQPEEVGRTLGVSGVLNDQGAHVFTMLGSPEHALRVLAMGYADGRFASGGWAWAEDVLRDAAGGWLPEQRADFLQALPVSAQTWRWVEDSGQLTEHAYWREVNRQRVQAPDMRQAVIKLIEHGRSFAAVDLLGMWLHTNQIADRPDPLLVAAGLERASTETPGNDIDTAMLAHHVAELLTFVEESGTVDETLLVRLEWIYFALLESGRRPPRLLHGALARDPAFFADVVSAVYKAEGEEQTEVDEAQRARAELSYRLLRSWRVVPGRRDDGSIDPVALSAWVDQARALLASRRRAEVGDVCIGNILEHGPADADGTWPARAIRDIIERVASEDLEDGIEVEVTNSRGVTSRGLIDEGQPERELAEGYQAKAKAVASAWPRTAAMLRRVAHCLRHDARWHDNRAELTEDMWR